MCAGFKSVKYFLSKIFLLASILCTLVFYQNCGGDFTSHQNSQRITESSAISNTTPISQTDSPLSLLQSDGMKNLSADGHEDNTFPLAFPGALGGGKYSSGGRGGKVVIVNTRTNDCNSNNDLISLNEALSMTEPRYIVFAVDGIIELSACGSKRPSNMGTFYMREENSHVTVACQTSPGKMVIRVSALNHSAGMSNAIYRHCAFRGARITGGNARGTQRAVAIFPNKNKDSVDFIFDHNTFSWTDDDVFQVYVAEDSSSNQPGNAKNITVQYSIGAEGDADSAANNSKDCHIGSGSTCITRGQAFNSQAGGINAISQNTKGRKAENITFTHNFQAHNSVRNCEFKGHVTGECSNNITYNWGGYGATWQAGYNNQPTQIRGKNNLFVKGPESQVQHNGTSATCHFKRGEGLCPIYISPPKNSNSGVNITNNYVLDKLGESPTKANLLPVHPSENIGQFNANHILIPVVEKNSILSLATKDSLHMKCLGASKPVRHQADSRIIKEMFLGTGKIGIGEDIRSKNGTVNSSTHDTVLQRDWSEFSGLSKRNEFYDTDQDGMADEWEEKNGLDVGVQDHNGDLDNDGYTNIEEFLNDLARCSGT